MQTDSEYTSKKPKIELKDNQKFSELPLQSVSSELHETAQNNIDQSTSQLVLANNIPKLKTTINNNIIEMVLNMHSKPNFARNNIPQIISDIVSHIIEPLVGAYEQFLNFIQPEVSSLYKDLIAYTKNPMKDICTEYRFLKKIEELDLFKHPKLFTIAKELDEVFVSGRPLLKENVIEGCLCDVKHQLQKYFESPNIFQLTAANIDSINSTNKLNHFIKELWQSKVGSFGDKLVFPIFLYFDDFQINDPLGPRTHSICGIYFSIPVIP